MKIINKSLEGMNLKRKNFGPTMIFSNGNDNSMLMEQGQEKTVDVE